MSEPPIPDAATRLPRLRDLYRSMLFNDVVPWWQQHSFDRECGGYFSCLERDGRPWSTDKFIWMTGREIWMFSYLFNTVRPEPAWLAAAQAGADFLLRHAFQPDGKMYFRLARDGRPMSKVLSIYTEVFAAIAVAELSRASGDERLWARAMKMYDFLIPRFGLPSDTPMLGYPLDAQFHLHAHDMCRITVAWVFNKIRPAKRFEDDLASSANSIVRNHWKPELNALLENVGMDGAAMLDLPEGRMFHPGHAIESAWMLMEIAREKGDRALIDTAVNIILASLEQGWDREYGGLRYLTNVDGSPTHELGANLKLWWPHCETLYALLLGCSLTQRRDLWQWFEQVHDYALARFPDREHGEWFGYLDRDGKPVWTAKATAWKGFFHLPRALLRCHNVLDDLTNNPAGSAGTQTAPSRAPFKK
ncbi:MAG TPA: AGE family epimerase/isomerase [Verrucomicrobiae bacterium]|nr:AGE family epimerase/isomerase [Verrucomicrobiae bacterium]